VTTVDDLVARFAGEPGVTPGTGFGPNRGLRVNGRIFAIFMTEGLTLKLPRGRVDELVEAGAGSRFDSGRGRVMREWITLSADRAADWQSWAEEAFRYVREASAR
jgi:hypothetical protein